MMFSIKYKLILMLVILTAIPLGVLGYLSYSNLKDVGDNSIANVQSLGVWTINDSTQSLQELGENIIKNTAVDVAKQVEIYIRGHPNKTIVDLQHDQYFQSIAVQPVGKTGYTALTDVNSLICRFHASEKIVNLSLKTLSDSLPEFWGIMSKSFGGNPSSGYYDWKDPDGTIRPKYMYIAIANATTADGVRLSVAATTYIDEFSNPIKQTKASIEDSVNRIVENYKMTLEKTKKDTAILIIVSLVIVILWGIIFAETLARPIRKLTKAGNAVAEGQLDTDMPQINSNDEIRKLGDTINLLVGAIRYHKKKMDKAVEMSKENKEMNQDSATLKLEQENILNDIDKDINRVQHDADTDFLKDDQQNP